ncbi:MAG: MOSC domain-containing molybdenum cofactor biosynthesis protein [Candidatus Desulfovibrio kirbyi]|uniref:MOSC domain-containing molybdenum cofactor biosynthesis protein n=1 Tax=Candidatus Desulfovibrio kirbyi TaxID=2696086 RepID=A0A6L2R567_9BACT|nr:MOSC domain-containing protein [Desulfovibrio sp.]GFH62736.1 MAG: MOSC domain-containing molybdenum cofactor biosynthesis protein [Candidatus Desulfovibrio kirbyi]
MPKVIAVCTSSSKGTQKKPVDSVTLVENFGIENDAHAGGHWHRQVSLLSHEKIEAFKTRGALVSHGCFGENIIVEGINFAELPVGRRLACGTALLEISQIGKECHSHCQIYHAMGECIMPTQGVFAKVLAGGHVRAGDSMSLCD